MSVTIKILPEQITNKIAAGEVVERPCSAIKELVENALDAEGRDITVEIESGGRRLIRVTDDGHGMSREDALLSLERHATSKITSDSDLFTLTSLGFRGEALPSIASVSRFTLATRKSGSIEGVAIYAEGGRIKDVSVCGMAQGTVVTVRNLFFNTPARLKFLRSSETESGHVSEFLTRLALSRPDVRFTFINDGKVVFKLGKGDIRERTVALLGASLSEGLYPFVYHEDNCTVSGLAGRPETSRSTAGHMYTYINGRFIRDRVVQHSVLQAYRTLLERGRYPVVVLFITLPPSEIDVNVHPTKHEVRFRSQGTVHDIVQRGVESLLRNTPWVKSVENVSASLHVNVNTTSSSPVSEERRNSVRESLAVYEQSSKNEVYPLLTGISSGAVVRPVEVQPAVCSTVEAKGYFSSLTVIGQLLASYLICQDSDSLVIIDQHAAHERVAFEKLRVQWSSGKIASQRLLFAETVEFSISDASVIREHASELTRLGFELEPFGGSTWIVNEIPCLLGNIEWTRTLRDVLEELKGFSRSRVFDDIAERAMTFMACHSVVRGKHALDHHEILALFDQMDAAGFASNCPHGRPVYAILSMDEIGKMFKR